MEVFVYILCDRVNFHKITRATLSQQIVEGNLNIVPISSLFLTNSFRAQERCVKTTFDVVTTVIVSADLQPHMYRYVHLEAHMYHSVHLQPHMYHSVHLQPHIYHSVHLQPHMYYSVHSCLSVRTHM